MISNEPSNTLASDWPTIIDEVIIPVIVLDPAPIVPPLFATSCLNIVFPIPPIGDAILTLIVPCEYPLPPLRILTDVTDPAALTTGESFADVGLSWSMINPSKSKDPGFTS